MTFFNCVSCEAHSIYHNQTQRRKFKEHKNKSLQIIPGACCVKNFHPSIPQLLRVITITRVEKIFNGKLPPCGDVGLHFHVKINQVQNKYRRERLFVLAKRARKKWKTLFRKNASNANFCANVFLKVTFDQQFLGKKGLESTRISFPTPSMSPSFRFFQSEIS